ncbi:MAG: phosphoribosylamine--glycine ligase [Chloroflexota bacterium]
MTKQSILVIGSGGREHALIWKIAQSPLVETIYAAPGNGGTAELATNLPIPAADIEGLLAFATAQQIALTVVGPEDPLAAGIVDRFRAVGLAAFGPSQAATRLEASKAFAKQFMTEVGMPTAAYGSFTDFKTAVAYVRRQSGGLVVKASGLAAGKGVIVCDNVDQAEAALSEIMLDQAFGAAGQEVVIEERLAGPELSLLAFSDGRTVVPMLPARDHKRAFDGDQGPNTGGMGAFAPPPDVDEALIEKMTHTVLETAVAGMAERGVPYVGVLYAGLMLTAAGPKVLEFNCRFGDPETQVILPLLESDLVEIMWACIEGRLQPNLIRRRPGACATVVMAAPGYPGRYPQGLPISGLDAAQALDDLLVFQAGTAVSAEGQLVSNGGRVLAVSGLGDDLETAVNRAYEGVAQIRFDQAHYRTDIGRDQS